MAEDKELPPGVRIVAPDTSLKTKLGTAKLDTLFAPQVIEQAEKVIVDSADQFLEESLAEMKRLEELMQQAEATTDNKAQLLIELSNSGVALKTKAGVARCYLIAQIANSFTMWIETLGEANFIAANMTILKWHVMSMRQLFTLNVKGMGGASGQAIKGELDRLATVRAAHKKQK